MLNKEVKFGKEARDSIKQGIDILANAVKTTLGPRGNLVVIGKWDNGVPHVTKDGVTVAKSIQFKDEYMEAGASLIREAALKQLIVGDGTTTTTVISQALINYLSNSLEHGADKQKLLDDLKEGKDIAVSEIQKMAIPVDSVEQLKKVATISANNDESIGDLIAEAVGKIGRNGVITVDESSNINTSVEVISGMQFERGFISPHFITNIEKEECVLDNPKILITNQKVSSMASIGPILNQVVKNSDSILVIAEDFDSEVIETLKLNKLQGIIKICLVKAPSYGDYRNMILDDIAVLTGGENISYESSLVLSDTTYQMLGACKKVIVTKDSTTIIDGIGIPDLINRRVQSIQNKLLDVEPDNKFLSDLYQQRIAKLTGGVAIIRVGGVTELEMKERKDRVDDAIAATKAAIEEGIVCGGGIAYLQLTNNLPDCLKYALSFPLKLIVESTGETYDFVVDFIDKSNSPNAGYDAKRNSLKLDMIAEGIIDPAKTVRMAILNAISVSELFLKTECIIVPEEQPNLITL